jgi:hypothetical protein
MDSKFKKKISVKDKWENSITYRCECACGSTEHDVTLDFEIDKKFGDISLNFYKDISFSHYYIYRDVLWFDKILEQKNIIAALLYYLKNTLIYPVRIFWCRLKNASRLLFTGYLKMESDFLIDEGDHLDNFILALQEGRDMLMEKRNNSNLHNVKKPKT